MEVIISKFAGFCPGVKRALFRIEKENKNNIPVYIFGPIIHNEHVIENLDKNGIKTINNIEEIKNLSSGKLIIRTHGLAPSIEDEIRNLNHSVIDLTCPKVKSLQLKIKSYKEKKYGILIFGKKGHPEVDGLLGYAADNGFLLSNISEIDNIPSDFNDKFKDKVLLSQTTQSNQKFHDLSNALKEKYPNLLIDNTICATSRQRQDDIFKMSDNVEAIIILGSENSSNTKEMVKTAQSMNIPTYFAVSIQKINIDEIKNYKVIGLSGGASTPDEILSEAYDFLIDL